METEDISEVKHRLIEAALTLIGGADKLPHHDLISLWRRHGYQITKIVEGADLTIDQLHAIANTAEPGSFDSIAHLAPLQTQIRKYAVFYATAAIAVSLLTRARLIPTGPRTITGPAPASQPFVPIRVQVPTPPAVATPQNALPEFSPVVPKHRLTDPVKERDDPQITETARRPPETIMSILLSDLSSQEKSRLSWNFMKRLSVALLCTINIAALFVGAWYGMSYTSERLGRAGSILGFVLSLITLLVNGIPWWKYYEKEV